MGIWIAILLSVLPQLLEWLLSLLQKREQVPERFRARLNHVVWYASQVATVAPGVGLVKGGTPPEED